jgi:RsiW-degrading membrane proteinase PrsW (M82 family)
MQNFDPQTIGIALLGGILPALIWLWFWLKEDSTNPEPKGLLLLTFLGGILSVVAVLPLQRFSEAYFSNGTTLMVVWAGLEEIVKYIFVAIIALRSRHCDEPIDFAIYMITGALGFAALENALFLLDPLSLQDSVVSLLTGNLRFIGSMLLHVVASGIIGMAIGFAYYKNFIRREIALFTGIILSIALHSAFNYFIINNNQNVFSVFTLLWIVTIVFIFLFELLRRLSGRNYRPRFEH